MEYVEGKRFATVSTEGSLTLDEARNVAIEVAGALAQAHQLGIVHRDIKPGNIMLTKPG